jgi:probable rRNA maturation factor
VISFFYEEVKPGFISESEVSTWLESVISNHNKHCAEISIIFCTDNYLLQINKNYLNHNYYTDVITFDYTEGVFISGDIFISIDTVTDNAKQYSKSFINELCRVMVHGTLHLIGFNDKTDKQQSIMTAKEDEALAKLKF